MNVAREVELGNVAREVIFTVSTGRVPGGANEDNLPGHHVPRNHEELRTSHLKRAGSKPQIDFFLVGTYSGGRT